MISVLTITYKRHHLLEEAIESFLKNMCFGAEMVVINDNPEVEYVFNHPSVRIINHKERFPSIAAKLRWGYQQCNYEYIYRLDDDDLISSEGLTRACEDILSNPGFDIYRSRGHYWFTENKFVNESDSINNGNIYTKTYLERIVWPDKSGDEDVYITFHNNADIYNSNKNPTMIYRWGMNTLHISGMGIQPNNVILAKADEMLDNTAGVIELSPHFKEDYYSQLPPK
jgi:glycosyltransferase involved in cell wall biosynthesis